MTEGWELYKLVFVFYASYIVFRVAVFRSSVEKKGISILTTTYHVVFVVFSLYFGVVGVTVYMLTNVVGLTRDLFVLHKQDRELFLKKKIFLINMIIEMTVIFACFALLGYVFSKGIYSL